MNRQPPSGGCVLKRYRLDGLQSVKLPAAFRRLCVETTVFCRYQAFPRPAAFRRLCVETSMRRLNRLMAKASRLQAAVC